MLYIKYALLDSCLHTCNAGGSLIGSVDFSASNVKCNLTPGALQGKGS